MIYLIIDEDGNSWTSKKEPELDSLSHHTVFFVGVGVDKFGAPDLWVEEVRPEGWVEVKEEEE